MTTVYGALLAGVGAGTGNADGGRVGGRVRVHTEVITMAAQATSNTIPVAYAKTGWSFLFGIVTASATLGSSTIAIGISGSTAKYKAAATFTSADTPTLFGKAAAMTKLTADETLFITIAAAALPGAGTLTVTTYWSTT